ncbi:MAG: dTMP kinase [Anaerovoracaceae bacterium]|jgi:dTMP kinase
MKRGLFITFEGTDGSGKSTQVANVRRFLEEKGIPYLYTREPGGTPVGEKIRDVILDPENRRMEPLTEALLYAASRCENVRENICPALSRGELVLCDRFLDSSIAYQGAGRELGEIVRTVNRDAVAGLVPDRTYLFDLPPEIGRKRIEAQGSMDRIEREELAFHRRVREGYLKLAEQEPERFLVLDGTAARDALEERILNDLRQVLTAAGVSR